MTPSVYAAARAGALSLLVALSPSAVSAQGPDSSRAASPGPFVAGGYDDKPYVYGVFGRIVVGGYAEMVGAWKREDGAPGESGFELRRWNLLTSTRVGDHVRFWGELEVEDAGEEVTLELAQIDLELHPACSVRGGMLLVPLGRFNLAHDAPRNEFVDRPFVASELLGTALSMPGLGLFGSVAMGTAGRATYEAYAVNGYDAGLLDASPGGTRLPAGRLVAEDNNASPAFVARTAWRGGEAHECGLSGYTGVYNVHQVEGIDVDDARSVRVGVADARAELVGLRWNAEATVVEVQIPPALAGIYASRQAGFFLETSRAFGRGWVATMPGSAFSAGVRAEGVDFDRDVPGDSAVQLTCAVNFRPTPESVLKLDYRRARSRDRFNNSAESAAIQFSLTTYF